MSGGQPPPAGVTFHDGGVTFRVWAPFADSVALCGDFNDWSRTATPLSREGSNGYWVVDVPNVQPGQEYNYIIRHGEEELVRNDPRAGQLSASGDKSVIIDPHFDWEGDDFIPPPPEQQIIYELHVGTFNRPDPATPGTFATAAEKLDYLASLGVTTIELMPCNSVWEDIWWGYTPSNIYAIEAAYGGRRAFQSFVKAAHQRGLAVILDVVYNHIDREGSQDLWRFDGWSENNKGGIYFYNDWRSETPWGEVRPDYGRPEVRDFIADNARLWLQACHVDGLRLDSVLAMRKAAHHQVDGSGEDIAEAWQLLQRITTEAQQERPGALLIAEDLQGNEWLSKPAGAGGAGFSTQWDPSFAMCLREVLDPPLDESRQLTKIRYTLENRFNGNTFERVIYSESHDNDANGHARLNEEIAPGAADSLFARKRSALAAALLFTAPGIPMIFQGQEFLEYGAFNHWRALDWRKAEQFANILQLHKDLIALRRNVHGTTRGLLGQGMAILHLDDNRVLVFHRWDQGGPGDDVVVVVNFTNQAWPDYRLTFPRPGLWKARFSSDWQGYGADLGNLPTPEVTVEADAASVQLAPYSVVIYSQ